MKNIVIGILVILLSFCLIISSVYAAGLEQDKYPNNGLTDEELQLRIDSSEDSSGDSNESSDTTPTTPLYEECPIFVSNVTGEPTELYNALQDLFNLIKIASPVLVIVLSTIDYLSAIAKSDDNEVKKATNRTIKRAAIGLAIFFLPFFLDIVFQVFGLVDVSRCQIGS